MGKRHPNHRLVKIHRNYTVDDVSRLLGVHKNTVRAWIKAGLPVMDEKRPLLILGYVLRDFLKSRRTKKNSHASRDSFTVLNAVHRNIRSRIKQHIMK